MITWNSSLKRNMEPAVTETKQLGAFQRAARYIHLYRYEEDFQHICEEVRRCGGKSRHFSECSSRSARMFSGAKPNRSRRAGSGLLRSQRVCCESISSFHTKLCPSRLFVFLVKSLHWNSCTVHIMKQRCPSKTNNLQSFWFDCGLGSLT